MDIVMPDKRNFSDADIEALVKKMKEEFFSNIGIGVWGFAWKGIIIALVALALYGAGLKHWWQ